MTTRTGEPATKRESYTAYIQGRAAKVSSRPETPTAASVHPTAARLPDRKINLEPLTPRISRRAPARLATHPRLLPPSFNRRCPTSTPWTARTLSPSRSTSTTSSATGSASRCVARPVTALSAARDGDGSAVAGCFESIARLERPAAPNSRRCRSPSVECLEGLFESAHVPHFAPRLTSTVSIGPRR